MSGSQSNEETSSDVKAAVYDAKRYDREFFERAPNRERLSLDFFEFRLSAESAATASGREAVVVFVNDRVDQDCLRELSRVGVRHVALRCAGFNNVDIQAAKELGILVTRVPAYSPHAVAEHTVALLLTLNRRIHRAHNRVREQNFSLAGLVGFDIFGKTVGVVGAGKIGRIVAEIFRGFGARVLAYDPFPQTEWADRHEVEYVGVDELLGQSDIVSLHLPLTPESLQMFDDSAFSKMKPGAYLVNTSRGKLINSAALIRSLKSGHVGGVALDVYEEEEGVFFEDLSDTVLHDDELSRLLSFPNVLVTSHQAFLTQEALTEIARVTTSNLCRVALGEDALPGTSVE